MCIRDRESSATTETFLAHNVPDKVVSKATPIGLLIMMAIFDWRLGLMSLIPAIIAFVLMFTAMMGPKMAEDMKQYQNDLETMSSEAVELSLIHIFSTSYLWNRYEIICNRWICFNG